jgi:ATP-dependent DNA helicase RecG
MDINSPASVLPLVGPVYQQRLEKLEIRSISDLLHHVPHRYLDFSHTVTITFASIGDTVTVKGEVVSFKNQYTRSGRQIEVLELQDSTGKVQVIWFNQPYLVNSIKVGDQLAVAGELTWFGRKKAFISPEYGINSTGRIVPIYSETAGISSKWLRARIKDLFTRLAPIPEFLPKATLEKLGLIGYWEALLAVHFPQSLEEAQKGRIRLAFNELLAIQTASLNKKIAWQKNHTVYQLKTDKLALQEFVQSLQFKLTQSQQSAIEDITHDLSGEIPMNRLLEGDVGSGKTVVAAAAIFQAFINGYQTVFMVPTQILAQQHFNTLKQLFEPYKIRIALVTGAGIVKDIGKTDVFIGTQALLNQKTLFEKTALVVIDEQHRFGVEQRELLIKRSGKRTYVPHILNMTATPIPRTIALSLYGDLDLSTLNELPPNRQKITTWVVPSAKRDAAYEWIKTQKTQVFIVCPLIEEGQTETTISVKSAKKEYENLLKIFTGLKLDLLHGKLTAGEKNTVIAKFKQGETDILVTTPVVEVGLDVPNANIMLIEGTERFGLAQLHQLRGRVGRGSTKSYCLLFTDSESPKVITRLTAMQKNLTGFELAELDLHLRGPGEIYGVRQHGIPALKIASWQDIDLIKKAKEVATSLIID